MYKNYGTFTQPKVRRRARFVLKPNINVQRMRRIARPTRAVAVYNPPNRMYRGSTMTVNKSRSVIANRYKTKMVYSDAYDIQTSAGAIAWTQFRINGLYDPDITYTGHQPMGFDQLCPTLYGRYVVTGCKVKIEGRFRTGNLDTNPVTGNLIVGAQPVANVLLPANLSASNESRQFYTITRTDQDSVIFTKYFDIAKEHGVSKQVVLNEENFSGTSVADPQKTLVLSVGHVNTNQTVVCNFNYTITLVFYVQFYSPVALVQS